MNQHGQNRNAKKRRRTEAQTQKSVLLIVDLDSPRAASSAIERTASLFPDTALHIVGREEVAAPRRKSIHCRRLRELVQGAKGVLPSGQSLVSEVRSGRIDSVALAAATEVRPSMIVIGSPGTGQEMVAIADALALPLLVARPPTRSSRAIAATDVRHELTPVLGVARRILGPSHGVITLFHASTPSCRHRRPPVDARFDQATCDRLLMLYQLGPDTEHVRIRVSEGSEPVRAILEFADRNDVDVVTVGYRQQPSFARVRHHTTARIIDGATCSVLVAPFARDQELA